MQDLNSIGTADRPAIATAPVSRRGALPAEQRAWTTAPLWMQLATIAAAIALAVWVLDEIF